MQQKHFAENSKPRQPIEISFRLTIFQNLNVQFRATVFDFASFDINVENGFL